MKQVRYAIFTTLATLIGLWLTYQIRHILVILFVSFILMSAMKPLVVKAQKFKIPRSLTIITLYLASFVLFFGILASLIPVIISQTTGLIDQLPQFFQVLDQHYHLQIDPSLITQNLNTISSNLFKLAGGVFSNALDVFAILFLAYYMIVERNHVFSFLSRFLSPKNATQVNRFLDLLEIKIGYWFRGELLLMLIIGVATYLGLLLLKIPYALPLALLAGLLEVVPNIGPTISAIFTIAIGLTVSPLTALGALILGIVIQQLENNLIVPQVMHYAVGLSPLLTLVILLIGLKLGGITGAILAIPSYLVIDVILELKQGGSHAK